jgi:hypothetical protein
MSITPEQAEIISEAIESRLIDVHTFLPGKVQSYNHNKRTAEVELQIKRTLPKEDGTFVTEDLPILINVLVGQIQAGGFLISLPIKAGDTGKVFFSEASIDQWRSLNTVTSPGDVGRFTLTGAVFSPDLVADVNKTVSGHADNLVIGLDNDNGQIHVTPSGSILLGADATKAVARVDDEVEITFAVNEFMLSAQAPVYNTVPLTFKGKINAGSSIVKASD